MSGLRLNADNHSTPYCINIILGMADISNK